MGDQVAAEAEGELPALGAAAQALEVELERFERLAQAVERERLASGRELERMARALGEATEVEGRIALRVAALVAAFGAARQRQEQQAARMRERAQELEQRTAQFRALMESTGALGEQTKRINELARELAAARARRGAEPNGGETNGSGSNGGGSHAEPLAHGLAELAEGVAQLVERAQALALSAREAGFPELARLSETLRQQLLAARNRLALSSRD